MYKTIQIVNATLMKTAVFLTIGVIIAYNVLKRLSIVLLINNTTKRILLKISSLNAVFLQYSVQLNSTLRFYKNGKEKPFPFEIDGTEEELQSLFNSEYGNCFRIKEENKSIIKNKKSTLIKAIKQLSVTEIMQLLNVSAVKIIRCSKNRNNPESVVNERCAELISDAVLNKMLKEKLLVQYRLLFVNNFNSQNDTTVIKIKLSPRLFAMLIRLYRENSRLQKQGTGRRAKDATAQ